MKKFLLLFILTFFWLSIYAQNISFTPTTLSPFSSMIDSDSEIQSTTVHANNFSSFGLLSVSVNEPFQVSLDQTNWGMALTISVNISTNSPGGMTRYASIPTTVYVRFSPTETGDFSENLFAAFGGRSNFITLSGSTLLPTSITNSINTNSTLGYPNPISGLVFNVAPQYEKTNYKIISGIGTTVADGNVNNGVISFANITSGHYTLVIISEDNTYTQSVIVP